MVARADTIEREEVQIYGPLADTLFQWVSGNARAPKEALVEGPAGTGKTRMILEALLAYAEMYPRSKIVFLRAERASMSETLLAEWEDFVLGPLYPECVRGQLRRDREKYTLPNGSEFILRGFDNEQKLFSGQYHVIYFNEATDLKSEDKWETLHRALRAVNVGDQPFRMLLADCNPRQRSHWLNRRAHDMERTGRAFDPSLDPKTGKPRDRMLRIRTAFKDNPRWFDHAANAFKPEYHEIIERGLIQGTSGVQHIRLAQGFWEDATGALMPEFSADRHVIDARMERTPSGAALLHVKGWDKPVELRWFFASFDAGYTTAVLGVWGVDMQGRMFEVAEVYRSRYGQNGERTGWTHDDWARCAVTLAREFHWQGMFSDHDLSLIEAVNRALIAAGYQPCAQTADKTMGTSSDKAKDASIEMVRSAFQCGQLFYVKDCNREIDTALIEMKRPNNTPAEIPNLRYREFEYGVDDIKLEGKVDKSIPDHGFDMTRYAVMYAFGRGLVDQTKPPAKYAPGTFGSIFGREEWEKRNRRPMQTVRA